MPWAIDPKACIRCAACATIAPDHFVVKGGPAKLGRPASNSAERASCLAAQVICPTQAIAKVDGDDTAEVGASPSGDLFPTVMRVAERVRWRMDDLPWDRFDPAKATDGLKAIVREMAYSEQTTFSATQKFMEAFGGDPDFSQWIAVWFYEETKHPLSLITWLERAGATPGKDFVLEGRASQPFMKSRIGTLVTNIISEMVASHAYLQMVGGAPEPVITAIVERLSADEARHGASFFAFARKIIAASEKPDRERLDALKVLHFWLNASKSVGHPVNESMDRLKALLPAVGAAVFAPPVDRIAQIIGTLTGLPIQSAADVGPQMAKLSVRLLA